MRQFDVTSAVTSILAVARPSARMLVAVSRLRAMRAVCRKRPIMKHHLRYENRSVPAGARRQVNIFFQRRGLGYFCDVGPNLDSNRLQLRAFLRLQVHVECSSLAAQDVPPLPLAIEHRLVSLTRSDDAH